MRALGSRKDLRVAKQVENIKLAAEENCSVDGEQEETFYRSRSKAKFNFLLARY